MRLAEVLADHFKDIDVQHLSRKDSPEAARAVLKMIHRAAASPDPIGLAEPPAVSERRRESNIGRLGVAATTPAASAIPVTKHTAGDSKRGGTRTRRTPRAADGSRASDDGTETDSNMSAYSQASGGGFTKAHGRDCL